MKASILLGSLISIGVIVSAARADVRLPRLVSNHMVLQRDAGIAVWGWADPGEKVQVVIHGQRAGAKADRTGRWSTSVGPFAAGGPYDLTIKGKNTLEIHDVLIGDVWVASGQSNMEFPVKSESGWKVEVDDADREMAAAHFPQIRLFLVEHNAAFKPVDDVTARAGWRAVTPESVADFSAVAYFFGRGLHQRYRVPIGIIESCWGGTVAEAWTSAKALGNFPEFRQDIGQMEHADEKEAVAELDRYKKDKAAWEAAHAMEDRGHGAWANPDFDASRWPSIREPQSNAEPAFEGFDGAVWFRKEIFIPQDQAGQNVEVHLTAAGQTDATYFNGEKIGETQGWDRPRDYPVPSRVVRAGRNVVAIRITGSDGYVGMFDSDAPDKMYVEAGNKVLPLAGIWSYQAAPDLTGWPVRTPLAKLKDNHNTATVLFNGMIAPLVSYTIKGVIWYQGESNTGESNAADGRSLQYRTLFPALIRDWREQWRYEFPFLFVQLAGWSPITEKPTESSFAVLREAQNMTLSLPATGMATAVDQPDNHPRDKQTVAARLVLKAAKVAYGEKALVDSGPIFSSMRIEGNQIRIRFSSLGSGLRVHDRYGYARGFEVAGADGEFQWAQARQDGEDILVWNIAIQRPTTVRYDWMNTPDGNVYNAEGLPALPFRTDAPKP